MQTSLNNSGSSNKLSRRSGGRSARIAKREARAITDNTPSQEYLGGQYRALSDDGIRRIHEGAIQILETVGMGILGDLPRGAKAILECGGILSDHNRILIPQSLVEDALSTTCRNWCLHGLDETRSIQIAPNQPHYGTAGGAVTIRDFHNQKYREPNLIDLYDVVRLIDTLPNIHWCYRPLIARDMLNVDTLDINTAYALIAGTTKPWGITIGSVENVHRVINMFDMALGGEGQFKKTPCCHSVQGDGVPPLRYAEERCKIKEASIDAGMPLMIASAPQAGATSPAALAGSLVQVVAEALAGLVYVHAISPGHPVAFAPWPFVADLRTGAMSGGSAEQAMLSAAVAQIGAFYDLPTSVPAGMADSKISDAQSGSEKAYTTLLAGMAGASMVHESAGMHASILGCALESFVIDNDMLGNILRTIKGIDVTDETLSLEVIADVNLGGPGHYLGHEQTINLMESEYNYPFLSDRKTPQVWEDDGALSIEQRARTYVADILANHYPDHIDSVLDAKYRNKFDILLPRKFMQKNYRW